MIYSITDRGNEYEKVSIIPLAGGHGIHGDRMCSRRVGTSRAGRTCQGRNPYPQVFQGGNGRDPHDPRREEGGFLQG